MSAFVTDTHPLVWHMTGQGKKLSRSAARVFQNADQGTAHIYVPGVALWEVATLVRKGQVKLPVPFPNWASKLTLRRGFSVVDLDIDMMDQAAAYASLRDPFDAAIAATARVLDLPLLTADERITSSGLVEVFW